MTEATPAGPRVSLVVVNYNTATLASRLLDGSEGGADEVVVVDNASTEGRIDDVAERHPGVRVLRLPRNCGYGAGANAGARECTGEVLVVANPDVQITAADLRKLAAVAAQPGVGVAAPSFVDGTGAFLPSSHYRDPGLLTTLWNFSSLFGGLNSRLRPSWNPTLRSAAQHASDHETVHVLGALIAIDAQAFARIGGFDERFFLYREETDLCDRMRQGGWTVRHVAGVTATHDGDASSRDHRPIEIRPASVRSHYIYLQKHRGRWIAGLAWLLGVFGSISWLVIGPRRRWAKESIRAHMQALPLRMRGRLS